MRSPGPSAALLVSALCAALSACTPAPAASPTPTPLYSSDAQALAAAEQVYRAYIDAYNDVDLADPATFEPVYALTTGDLLITLKERLTTWNADGWVRTGDSVVAAVTKSDRPASQLSNSVLVCLNVSAVSITDAGGTSQVPDNRPDDQSLFVEFERQDQSGGWKVAGESGLTGDAPCD